MYNCLLFGLPARTVSNTGAETWFGFLVPNPKYLAPRAVSYWEQKSCFQSCAEPTLQCFGPAYARLPREGHHSSDPQMCEGPPFPFTCTSSSLTLSSMQPVLHTKVTVITTKHRLTYRLPLSKAVPGTPVPAGESPAPWPGIQGPAARHGLGSRPSSLHALTHTSVPRPSGALAGVPFLDEILTQFGERNSRPESPQQVLGASLSVG